MTELDEVVRTSVRYASDAVLANAQAVPDDIKDDIKDRTSDSPIQTRDRAVAATSLVRNFREELVGKREADKTWRRYEAPRDCR
jgi:hypothetical protein